MNDIWKDIKYVAQYQNPDFRPIKAYVVNSDGSTSPIEGENIYLEVDNERGLFIPLCERVENEGIGIMSMPHGWVDEDTATRRNDGSLLTSPVKSSSIVIRNGGGNLVYISPEVKISRTILEPPE